jgi:tetratricopeptide (TPR) repeat protein
LVALADLAVRVDRLDEAEALYLNLQVRGEQQGDLHTRSLATLGLGRVAVRRGQYEDAARWLGEALAERALLGEKPYLLEIFNELGNLHVQRGDFWLAAHYFRRAERIAEDLDNDYFRAVLGNNLGVLAFLRGDTAWALSRFERAWEYVADLEEAEGQLAAGLNIGIASVTRGDAERAGAYLKTARQIVERTRQEGSLALVYAHRGAHALRTGEAHEALRALLRGWSLFEQLGRPVQSLRLRNNVSVADFGAFAAAALEEQDDEHLEWWADCLKHAFGDMLERGYGVSRWEVLRRPWGYWRYYWRPELEERWQGNPPPLVYLITRLNAETLARLDP